MPTRPTIVASGACKYEHNKGKSDPGSSKSSQKGKGKGKGRGRGKKGSDSQSDGGSARTANDTKANTLCRFFAKGSCNKGEACEWSHDPAKVASSHAAVLMQGGGGKVTKALVVAASLLSVCSGHTCSVPPQAVVVSSPAPLAPQPTWEQNWSQ